MGNKCHLVSVRWRPTSLVSCSSHSRALWPAGGDLENAQTTVTVESPNIASQSTTIVISDNAVQHNTCPVLPGLQARAEVRLIRSSGRRQAGLGSAPYRAGTVQCAAVRQIKPNHESCDWKHTIWHGLHRSKFDIIHASTLVFRIYNIISHLCICPYWESQCWLKGRRTSVTRPRRPVQSGYQHSSNTSSKSLCWKARQLS